jgi:hypothetical protein
LRPVSSELGVWILIGSFFMNPASMFAEPTLNDFLDCIRTKLDRITESAKLDVASIEAQSSRTGAHGNAIAQIFAAVTKRLDEGIDFALYELKRTIDRTTLDRRELRQHTAQLLENFVIAAKSITTMDRVPKGFPAGLANYIDGELAKFDQRLAFCLRQFDTGFLDLER